MTTPSDIIQAAQERHKALLAELGVLEKFIDEYGEATTDVLVPDDKESALDDKRFRETMGATKLGSQPPPIPDSLRRCKECNQGPDAHAITCSRSGDDGTRKPWTPKEDAQLQEFRKAGVTTEAIATNLGRTQSAVTARIYKLGLPPLPKDSPNFKKSGHGKGRRSWTEDQLDRLNLLYMDGSPLERIAADLHRSTEGVKRMVTKLGLSRPRLKRGRPKGSKTQKTPAPPVAPAVASSNGAEDPKPVALCLDPRRKPLASRAPAEPSVMNSWIEAEDDVLRKAWKGHEPIYAIAKRIGKPAPEIVRQAKVLKLGERSRRKLKRACVKCRELFKPDDWTKDYYCPKHKLQIARMTEDLATSVNVGGHLLA